MLGLSDPPLPGVPLPMNVAARHRS